MKERLAVFQKKMSKTWTRAGGDECANREISQVTAAKVAIRQ